MLGVGLSIPAIAVRGRAPYVFANTEASALVARMTVAPSAQRKSRIDTLVGSLKSAGVWSKLDCFYVMAAHDAQAARLNWKSSSFGLTPANSPLFTVDRGYAGDGSTSYLETGFNPTTAGGLMALNSATLGVVVQTTVSENKDDIGNNNALIRSRNAASLIPLHRSQINSTNTTGTVATADGLGFLNWVRDNSANYTVYKNGGALEVFATASLAMANDTFRIGGGYVVNFSTKRLSGAVIGGALTAAEVTALNTALSTYLTAVGAA